MSVRQPKSCCIRTLTLGRKSYKRWQFILHCIRTFTCGSEKKLYCIGFVFILVGRRQSILHCIHTYRSKTIYIVLKFVLVLVLVEVRLFILYSNLYLYLWEETICDTTLGVAAPIIRSAAANSYMYDIHYIHIIHTYSYIEFIHYTYVITYIELHLTINLQHHHGCGCNNYKECYSDH